LNRNYFLNKAAATWLSDKFGLIIGNRFLDRIADIQAKAIISGLVILVMGFDTFVRKL